MSKKINFKIVEGSYGTDVDFEQLKKDYLNPNVYVDDILKKHNISRREYRNLKARLAEETGVSRKPSNLRGHSSFIGVVKYISQDPLTQKYRVAKFVDGVLRHFGRYESLEDAINVRNKLAKNNWDWEYYINKIKPHYFSTKLDEKEDDVMNEFRKDYLNGMPVHELMSKYGLTKHRYYQLSTSIKHETGLLRKPTRQKVSI